MTPEPASGGNSPSSAAAKPPPAGSPKPARELPSNEQIAAWIEGAELPSLAALFEGLRVAKLDTFCMLIRKAELVPQHWQVLATVDHLDDADFDALPEVRFLQTSVRGREQTAALSVAWRELRGKRPALWTVPDLLAAIRRILDNDRAVDWSALLDGVRDCWRASDLPKAREELEVLWGCLALIRSKTK